MGALANARRYEGGDYSHSAQEHEVRFAEDLNKSVKQFSPSIQSFLFKWSTAYNLGFNITTNGVILVSEVDYKKLSPSDEHQFNLDRQAIKAENGVRVEMMKIIPPQSQQSGRI